MDWHFEGARQSTNEEQAGIAFAVLDARQIDDVNAGRVCKLLLEHLARFAKLPNSPGAGSVSRADIRSLRRLREQMKRVANLMQVGDADRGAEAYRTAVRLARPLLPHHHRAKPRD